MVLVSILDNQRLISNTGDSSTTLGMINLLYPVAAKGRNILLPTLTHKRIIHFRRDAMHRVSQNQEEARYITPQKYRKETT